MCKGIYERMQSSFKQKQILELPCEESDSATINSDKFLQKYLQWKSYLKLVNVYVFFFIQSTIKTYLIMLTLHPQIDPRKYVMFVYVCLCPIIVKASSVWISCKTREQINDVMLKRLISCTKYFHRYFAAPNLSN